MDTIESKICELESKRHEINKQLKELHLERKPKPVESFQFEGKHGLTTLESLFGDKDELIVIHNMGPNCPYCTLWADGFSGSTHHFMSRAAFALTTPTPYKEYSRFAEKRNWNFPIYSTINTDFQKAMGVCEINEEGEASLYPGVSTFFKKDGKVFKQTTAGFGPGDSFCSVWHFFDLLPDQSKSWGPKFTYDSH